jgi:hypothetical protein
MKTILAAAVLALFAVSAYAQEGPTPQQQLSSDCNGQANKQKLKGPGRKSYVDACMKGQTPPPAKKAASKKADAKKSTAQQEKMKNCNKQAGDRKLKGDDRKKFVSQCRKA